jgi:hypothetical protein
MAKRAPNSSKSKSTVTPTVPAAGNPRNAPQAKTTAVRNTAVPKVVSKPAPGLQPKPVASAGREATPDQIAKRAYEIYRTGTPGTQLDHWLQAERELKGL